MLSMRQSYRMIPVYTADVSGVCSALYELGGMTVMHDPSGCNSTYNTHDEIRWYDQDSLIFISGLTEIDAIMGNDRKFIDDIEYAARELHPKFIALAGSPIPFMNGTDFPAIARVIETETGIPAFSVPTNGMNDYVYGAGIALEEIAKRFVREPDRQENRDPSSRTVNLLGVTPLDFGPQKNAETLKENLQKYGWQVMSVWAMGDDLKTLQRSAEADVNLVVSAVGLRVAKILWEKYKIPYVIGTPNEWLAEDISNALERAATRQAEPAVVYLQNRMQQEADITLVGEPVTMGSLAAGIEKRYGRAARVLCPLKIKWCLERKQWKRHLKVQGSLWQILCIVRSVRGTVFFMNYRMWHFRGEYIFENTIVRMQIAICDDEKSIGLILEEKIKKLLPDAVIETYLSGDELIASGCKPDMLFLDIQMPGKNGMETARILRQKDDEVDVAA